MPSGWNLETRNATACQVLANVLHPAAKCDALSGLVHISHSAVSNFRYVCDAMDGMMVNAAKELRACEISCTIVLGSITRSKGVKECMRTVGNRALTNGDSLN